MEGESRLRRLQILLQVTHTMFSAPQHLEDAKTGFVGQRVKELRRA